MNKKHIWWAVAGVGAVAALGAVLWGPIASQVERARYKTVERKRNFEIRDYTPMIVAETEVLGDREEAIQRGFRTLADYIFGNNTESRLIAMRAAVTQQPRGEKIAMTAPVTQQAENGGWTVRFVMPARYTTGHAARTEQPGGEPQPRRSNAGRGDPLFGARETPACGATRSVWRNSSEQRDFARCRRPPTPFTTRPGPCRFFGATRS